jgi:Transposase DDE domain group 1
VSSVSRGTDRIGVTFDDPTLVADAGLIVPATLIVRLGLEALVNRKVRLLDRVGGARPGRKVLTVIAAILAGGTHIDHADRLRAGATHRVLPFRVMAPSTLGTFLRAFTFGHVRQLDAVIAETIRRAWSLGAGPSNGPMTIDMDSTICEVFGKAKQGAAYGYTRVLGYHPLVATWAKTGEVLHARLRKGSSQRGTGRFVEELVARVRRAGATGPLVLRADAGFFSYSLVDTLNRLGVSWSITVIINPRIRACIETIDESAWRTIFYPHGGEAQVAEATYVAGGYGNHRSLRRASDPPGGSGPADTVAKLAPPRLHHQSRHRNHRGRPVPSRTRHRRAGNTRPQRRSRARTLPIGQVLRQRGLARLCSPRP